MNSRLIVKLLKPAKPKPGAWGPQAEPVDPLDTFIRARAQSIMSPTPRGGACPPLSTPQAIDVLRWANEKIPN